MDKTEAIIRSMIREIPDYPKKGVLFRDITPLLKDKATFALCIDQLASKLPKGTEYVVGIEARGFIIGSALAYALDAGFVPVRKEGKLPWERIGRRYELEYGSAMLEVHRDALSSGAGVVIADDLLATGGTAAAAASLVRELGARVLSFAFVVELSGLNGRKKLGGSEILSLVKY